MPLVFSVHLGRLAGGLVRAAGSAAQALVSDLAVAEHLASDRLAAVASASIPLFSAGSLAFLRASRCNDNATLHDEVPAAVPACVAHESQVRHTQVVVPNWPVPGGTSDPGVLPSFSTFKGSMSG